MSKRVLRPGQDFNIRRGDILEVVLEGAQGIEKRGKRPALVVQTNREVGYEGSVIVAPITSQPDQDNLNESEVSVPATDETGLDCTSTVQVNQLRTVDIDERVTDIYGWVEGDPLERVDAALAYTLDID